MKVQWVVCLPGRGSEEEAIEEAAAEILQSKFISQQCQTPSEQVEKDVTEGQVTKGFHCKHNRVVRPLPSVSPLSQGLDRTQVSRES